MYVSVDKDKKLLHYCKNCNKKEYKETTDSELIITDNKLEDSIKFAQYVNPYLKHDPTLPRVSNIPCVNDKCSKKHDQPNDVIYLKYDFVNMKYLYYCAYCDTVWRT